MAGRDQLVLPPILSTRRQIPLPPVPTGSQAIPEPGFRPRICAPIETSQHHLSSGNPRLVRTFTVAGLSPPPYDRPLGGHPATNPPKRRPLTDKNDKLYLLRTKYSMTATAGPSSSPARDLFASPDKTEPRRKTLSPLRSAPPTYDPRPLAEIVPPQQFGGVPSHERHTIVKQQHTKEKEPITAPPPASPEQSQPEEDAELPPSAFGMAAGEGEGMNSLVACPTCQRNFAIDRLEVHQRICQKVAKNAATRGVYRRTAGAPAAPPAAAPALASGTVVPKHPAKRQNLRREQAPRTPSAQETGEESVPKTVRWLQQRCAEIEFTLRLEIRGEDDLLQAVQTLQMLQPFLERLEDCIVPRCGFAKDLIFQELLSRLQRDTDFDTQHGQAGVPMHQAKVLVRAERLAGVGEALERTFGADEITSMVTAVDALRRLLRIKVEDANDLRMAQAAIKDANAFVTVLQRHAAANGDTLFVAYRKLQ
eukprot:TRINITY_DN6630_c0_g1_i1.p1 TRINITY_DN6630_c0_g1~~TRINITY_DN6630_c0_g1_i1.p1  ORF type:complete len:496 (-),score=89.37 TRINITY_DN6630_c0_g1_i1:229-1665(-)